MSTSDLMNRTLFDIAVDMRNGAEKYCVEINMYVKYAAGKTCSFMHTISFHFQKILNFVLR